MQKDLHLTQQHHCIYLVLILLEHSNCIDWINLYTVTDQYTAFLLQMYLIHVERRLRNGTSISTDVIENTPENNENNNNVSAICIGIFLHCRIHCQ